MNLSSYLQMPPAPSVSPTPNTAVSTGAAAGVGPAAGSSLGLDFAKIMARQFERLPQAQRQAFAAPQSATEADMTRAKAQASAEAKSTLAADRQAQDQQEQQDQATPSAQRGRQANNRHSPSSDHEASPADHVSRRRATHQEASETANPSDPALASLPVTVPVQHQALPTPARAEVSAQALKGNPYLKDVALPSSDASGTRLHTVELSPHVRIITDPRKAPSPESLTAFAKSMGLDEAAIQKLMGPTSGVDPVPATSTPTASPESSGSLTLNNGLSNPAGLTGDELAPPHAPILSFATPTLNGTSDAVTQAAKAGPTLQPTLGDALQALAPADLANIQQMEINVLPASVSVTSLHGLSGKTTSLSTAAVLSMLGGGLSEDDINHLVANFEPGTAGGESATSQGQSQSDSGAGSFGQSLPRQALATSPSAASNTQNAAQVKMSEVYDQLSDKMATEMAARMHKQLSDGEWKMKFGLRPAHLGGVEIQLEMKDGKLNAMIQADNPLTRDLLQNSSQRLRDALENFGIQAGQVQIGQDHRGTQQNPSRDASKRAQVGDNSISQVKGSDSTAGDVAASVKASASLLDLYA